MTLPCKVTHVNRSKWGARPNVPGNGTRGVAGDTALRLAHFFGTSPQFWLNLQALYELRLAERKAGKAIRSLPTLKRHKKARGGFDADLR